MSQVVSFGTGAAGGTDADVSFILVENLLTSAFISSKDKSFESVGLGLFEKHEQTTEKLPKQQQE